MASQGQAALENRRRQEDRARAMQASLNDAKVQMAKANFEISTTRKLEQRTRHERFNNLRHQQQMDLLGRKQQLADLYNYEREAWKDEVLSKVETVEDRKNRIMERAYKLRDARESSRMEFVQKCYDQQWREACDEARTLDSKAMLKWTNDERVAKMEENVRLKREAMDNDGDWLAENAKYNTKLAAAEKAKEDYRAQAAADLQEGLRKQMHDNFNRKKENLDRTQAEADAEINSCKDAIRAEADLQRKLKEDAYENGRRVQEFNAKYSGVRAAEEAEEKRQDAQLLSYALRKEREAIAAEQAKKEGQKQAALQYQQYLKELMIKEAEDNSEIDAVRLAEENKIWKARDKVLQDREDARAYLMNMVDSGRQEQIRFKKEREAKAKEDEKIYSQRFLTDAAEGLARERAETQRRRELAEYNNQVLTSQIEQRRMRAEMERQEAYLADKHMQRIERLTKEKLAQQAGQVRKNFGSQSIKWYS